MLHYFLCGTLFISCVIVCFSTQDLRKQLSCMKIEKDEWDSALSESKRETKVLEQKHKVTATPEMLLDLIACHCLHLLFSFLKFQELVKEFGNLYSENEGLKSSISALQKQYRSTEESNEVKQQMSRRFTQMGRVQLLSF